jgi:hypothetical protein
MYFCFLNLFYFIIQATRFQGHVLYWRVSCLFQFKMYIQKRTEQVSVFIGNKPVAIHPKAKQIQTHATNVC